MNRLIIILLDITKGRISNEALLYWGKIILVFTIVILSAIVMYESGLHFYKKIKRKKEVKK